MSLFRELDFLPRSSVDIVIDFVYTRDEDNWKRCTYELIHYRYEGITQFGWSDDPHMTPDLFAHTFPLVDDDEHPLYELGCFCNIQYWWCFDIPIDEHIWDPESIM